jgi:hypothetical protein
MNTKQIKWGNIELPGLSDNDLYSKEFRDIKSDSSKEKVSKALKGKPKSKKHKEALKGKRKNPGMMGKSKSEAKIKACQKNARLGGLTGAGAKATQLKYAKPIYCYEYPSMKFICEYIGAKEASRQLELNAGNISNVLKNRCKQTGGYYFQYKK